MPPPPAALLGAAAPPATGDAALHAEIARLRQESAAMRASTSWRITAPLRALAGLVRGR
jgi:hypothetical protein